MAWVIRYAFTLIQNQFRVGTIILLLSLMRARFVAALEFTLWNYCVESLLPVPTFDPFDEYLEDLTITFHANIHHLNTITGSRT